MLRLRLEDREKLLLYPTDSCQFVRKLKSFIFN
jgi:hypothetical protein